MLHQLVIGFFGQGKWSYNNVLIITTFLADAWPGFPVADRQSFPPPPLPIIIIATSGCFLINDHCIARTTVYRNNYYWRYLYNQLRIDVDWRTKVRAGECHYTQALILHNDCGVLVIWCVSRSSRSRSRFRSLFCVQSQNFQLRAMCRAGDLPKIKQLIERGADVQSSSPVSQHQLPKYSLFNTRVILY